MRQKNISLTVAVVCMSIMQFFCVAQVTADGNDIEVLGSREFIAQVTTALDLLRNQAPEEYELIRGNVGRIRQGQHSGMAAYEEPPTYEMNDRTAFYSLTWCASTIAHDAYHSKLYHDYKTSFGEPVPEDVWTGQQAELECMEFQAEVLRKIGAPEGEIRYLNSLDGTHYDVDKNGRYDENDYNARDW